MFGFTSTAQQPGIGPTGTGAFIDGPPLPPGAMYIGGNDLVRLPSDDGLRSAQARYQDALSQAASVAQQGPAPVEDPTVPKWYRIAHAISRALLAAGAAQNPNSVFGRGYAMSQAEDQRHLQDRRFQQAENRQAMIDRQRAQALQVELARAGLDSERTALDQRPIDTPFGPMRRDAIEKLAGSQVEQTMRANAPLTAAEREGFRLEGLRVDATNRSTDVMDAQRRDAREALGYEKEQTLRQQIRDWAWDNARSLAQSTMFDANWNFKPGVTERSYEAKVAEIAERLQQQALGAGAQADPNAFAALADSTRKLVESLDAQRERAKGLALTGPAAP